VFVLAALGVGGLICRQSLAAEAEPRQPGKEAAGSVSE
jgi:hypothetical protein